MHCHNMNVNSPSRIWDFLSTHANSEIAYFGQIFHGQNIERSEIQVHPVLSPQEPLPDEQQQKYFIHGFFLFIAFLDYSLTQNIVLSCGERSLASTLSFTLTRRTQKQTKTMRLPAMLNPYLLHVVGHSDSDL